MSAKVLTVALITGAGVIGGAMMGCYCYCKSKDHEKSKTTNNRAQSQERDVTIARSQVTAKTLNSSPSQEGIVSSSKKQTDQGTEFKLHTFGITRASRTASRFDRIGTSWHQRR